ncbi:MAG: rlmN2, partial [Chlamydiales bacterium]|nr:rlmN2 [Chlamydiales bacterium]
MFFFQSSEAELKEWVVAQGEKPFLAKQIIEWVYQKQITDPLLMTNIAKKTREKLAETLKFITIEQVKREDSSDQETFKFLWRLADGKLVESVLILSFDRRTVCVSSQVGCPARCSFCASGKQGLIRNLSASEIVEQVFLIDRFLKERNERVSHIVFMGMGEPLKNYDAVKKAVSILIDPTMLALGQRRITISTVGIIEEIRKLAEEDFRVNLVLSLHAPNQ